MLSIKTPAKPEVTPSSKPDTCKDSPLTLNQTDVDRAADDALRVTTIFEQIGQKLHGKRRDAAMLFCRGMRSITTLAKHLRVTRDTCYRWKKQDGWMEWVRELDGREVAGASQVLTTWKDDAMVEIREDMALLDKAKKNATAKSLEGIIKMKAELRQQMLLMMGEATARNEQIVVSFGGHRQVVTGEERGPVPRRPGEVRSPLIEATAEVLNTADTEGGQQGETGGKGDSIEKLRGSEAVHDSKETGEVPNDKGGETGARGDAGVDQRNGANDDGAGGVSGKDSGAGEANSSGGEGGGGQGEENAGPKASGGVERREDGMLVIKHGVQTPRAQGGTMQERRENATKGRMLK